MALRKLITCLEGLFWIIGRFPFWAARQKFFLFFFSYLLFLIKTGPQENVFETISKYSKGFWKSLCLLRHWTVSFILWNFSFLSHFPLSCQSFFSISVSTFISFFFFCSCSCLHSNFLSLSVSPNFTLSFTFSLFLPFLPLLLTFQNFIFDFFSTCILCFWYENAKTKI